MSLNNQLDLSRLIRKLSKQGLSNPEFRGRIWSDMGISRSSVAIWIYRKQLQNDYAR